MDWRIEQERAQRPRDPLFYPIPVQKRTIRDGKRLSGGRKFTESSEIHRIAQAPRAMLARGQFPTSVFWGAQFGQAGSLSIRRLSIRARYP